MPKKLKPATKRSRKSATTGGARRSTKWSFGVGITSTKTRDSISRSMQRLDDQYGEAGALAVLGALLEREAAAVGKPKKT